MANSLFIPDPPIDMMFIISQDFRQGGSPTATTDKSDTLAHYAFFTQYKEVFSRRGAEGAKSAKDFIKGNKDTKRFLRE
jgi:hypothetical protein